MIPKNLLNHMVARVSGIKETDTRMKAAEKALATMRLAGFSKAVIAEAERIIANAKKKGYK